MIKAVIFDMYETLITLFESKLYKGKEIAAEMNIPEKEFRKIFSDDVFSHKHPDIIPMLKALRENGIKTGLISNCYFEERDSIKKSDLYDLFDAVCLSCEVNIKKPDRKIFELCIEKLNVAPDECLYVGDGGSHELEAARDFGMKPLQAAWYLKEGVDQPCGRLDEFDQADVPMDVVKAAME